MLTYSQFKARKAVVPSNFDGNGMPVDELEMRRAAPRGICPMCDREWLRHPFSYMPEHLDCDGEPYLHVACDGALLKL